MSINVNRWGQSYRERAGIAGFGSGSVWDVGQAARGRLGTVAPMKRGALATVLLLAGCSRQPPEFDRTEVMIPMRDGARLHTLIYAPHRAGGKLPFLIERSPYGWNGKKPESALKGRYQELAAEGYIFVLQDIRGRYGSDGVF